MENRKLVWWESSYDLQRFAQNQWNYQAALQVVTRDGPQEPNVVWRTNPLSPRAEFALQPAYALNFTTGMGSPGAPVQLNGQWQPCNFGDAYDLNAEGFFQTSSSPGQPGWLTMGSNDMPGDVHIVVGMLNPDTGSVDPIFVDPMGLMLNASTSYQPNMVCSLWAAPGYNSGSLIGQIPQPATQIDMSQPNPMTGMYEWWTTYLTDDGNWTVSPNAPNISQGSEPSSESKPTTSETLAEFPMSWNVFFSIPLSPSIAEWLVFFLRERLSPALGNLEIVEADPSGRQLRITYSSIMEGQNPMQLLNSALQEAIGSGRLPPGETWEFVPGAGSAATGESEREAGC